MNLEQRAIFESKPLARMHWFASLLNWRGLQLDRILFTAEQIQMRQVPAPGLLAYYMTTDPKFNLQINEIPSGQSHTHQATIKADRYGICNTGWQPFTLYDDDDALPAEAERLAPILERTQYKNRKWLRDFQRTHPEAMLRSRKKRRGRPR